MSVEIACSASRRDFLRSATAAAGAVAFGAAQSAGAQPIPGTANGPASAAPHRSFTSFCGRVEDGRVILSAFKAVRYTADSAKGEFATIRVYRRPVDFVWCTDYEEFFNGLAPDKDDLIFRGPIEAVNKDKFTYVDAKAEEGKTYAYGRPTSDPYSETYRGPKPASEQETQAIVKLFEAHPPAVTYSFHGTGNSLLAARLSEKDPAYVAKLKRWSQIYGGGCEGRKPVTTSLYFGCTAGSLSAWIYRRFGAPAFDVEGGGMGPTQHSAGILAVAQTLAGTENAHRKTV
jgi:hypothetical protein